jgi:YidC/Oxa1 family membrane protein insertase
MDKKTVTAILLILLVALAYPQILQKFFPNLYPPQVQEQAVPEEPAASSADAERAREPEQAAAGDKKEKAPGEEKPGEEHLVQAVYEEKFFSYDDRVVSLQFSNRGGGMKSAKFKKYKTDLSFTSPEEYILSVLSIGTFAGLENQEFQVKQLEGGKLFFEAVIPERNLKIEKTFEPGGKDYFFLCRIRITNTGEQKFYMPRGPVVVAGTVVFQGKKSRSYAKEEATALPKGGEVMRKPRKEIEGSIWEDGLFQWVGVQDTTACFIFMGNDKSIDGWNVSKRLELEGQGPEEKEPLQTEVITSAAKLQGADIGPGDSTEYTVSFYAGPKLYYHLASVGMDFKKIVDFGKWLAPISRSIIWGLNKLHFYFSSYGICIIILTAIVKIILYPLTHSSMKSMQRMKELQPHMEAIREQYKNDPARMNREVMGLYKKHKVNPVGGCFPMLLQLPIFLALYQTLNNAVELQGASFLWIKDLSVPDTVAFIGSFPVNILPVIMGLTQFISQKQTLTDPRQAQMMNFMTIFFMFIFYSMPSGLVLYWLVSNVLSIIQQAIINKSLKS